MLLKAKVQGYSTIHVAEILQTLASSCETLHGHIQKLSDL